MRWRLLVGGGFQFLDLGIRNARYERKPQDNATCAPRIQERVPLAPTIRTDRGLLLPATFLDIVMLPEIPLRVFQMLDYPHSIEEVY